MPAAKIGDYALNAALSTFTGFFWSFTLDRLVIGLGHNFIVDPLADGLNVFNEAISEAQGSSLAHRTRCRGCK